MAGFLIFAVTYLSKSSEFPLGIEANSLFAAVGLLIVSFAFSGIYTAIKSWINFSRFFTRFALIERKLNLVEMDIMPERLSYKPPKDSWHALRRLVWSFRSTLIFFYIVLVSFGFFLISRHLLTSILAAIGLTIVGLLLALAPINSELKEIHALYFDKKSTQSKISD
ncbi:hypothetical protein CMO96_04185 [Candidatus Woesebacteria bacterium]|nr:hypothetical protein [Candidatus Woesebacteria bacterium]